MTAATVRVWVPDVWNVIELPVTPDVTVGDIKTRALAGAIGGGPEADPALFLVKYRGALLDDEAVTVGQLGVPDRAPMIVLPTHRRPVT